MAWKDMKIQNKLLLGFGVITALLLAVGAVSIISINNLLEDHKNFKYSNNFIIDFKEREINHLDWVIAVDRGLIDPSSTRLEVEPDPRKCTFGKWYYSDIRKQTELMAPSVKDHLKNIEEYHTKIHESAGKINSLLSKGDIYSRDMARTVFNGETMTNLHKFRETLDQVNNGLIQQGDLLEKLMISHAEKTRMTIIIVCLMAVLTGIILSAAIAYAIKRPLDKAVSVAAQLAEGDNPAGIEVDRKDEMGLLLKSMDTMSQSISQMASVASRIADGDLTAKVAPRSEKDIMGSALVRMVDYLRDGTRAMMEGVNVLASSAGEISASMSQFSSTAVETAASLTETTATIEEVKQTAQVASQKATYASEIAQKAAQASQAGRKSVEDTVEGMNQVREKMESIAESIVRLSEQGMVIGEIIATVDDLAEQSNLLAVNASIEAAKAGEQGKGFAVVAQEIKSLAQQSRQATAQVRAILNDIQKATSASVIATEQGGKTVEAVVKQSDEAAQSIRNMAGAITETAQALAQIAATAQQQYVGMDQASLAMENISQASSQSVEGARQLESAARDLGELGQRLKQLVERFKV